MTESSFGEAAVTKHALLRSALLEQIADGTAAHQPIPSERELMATHGLSRATVREAIRQLVEEGVLYKVQGKGTFVAGERVQSQLHLASFTDDMRRRGLVPATVVRQIAQVEAPLAARAALRLDTGAKVWSLERLRLAGGVPMALERAVYRADLMPDLGDQDLSTSVYAIAAERYGLRVDNAEQTVWAEVADAATADLLGVAAGAPLMVFRRTSSAGDVPVEHVTSWYRGDRYQVHMTLAGTR